MKRLLVCSLATLAAAAAHADAAYGDGAGVLTYKPGASANAWSDTSKWYYSATDVAAETTPTSTDDVVLTVPIAKENPLTLPAEGVTVNNFEIGCPRKGTSGDWNLLFPSGSSLTIGGESIWARNAGTVLGTIESGATLTTTGQLMLGRTDNSFAVITNRGAMVANGALILGGFNKSFGQIDIFGTLTVNGAVSIGKSSPASGRIVLHEGGTLSKPLSTYPLNVGEGTTGELVLEDVYYPCKSEAIVLGAGNSAFSSGKLILRGKGGINISSGSGNLRVGHGTNAHGELEMSGTTSINGTSGMHLYVGYGEKSSGKLTLSDSASIIGAGDRDPHFGYGKSSRAEVSLSGSAYVKSASQFYMTEGVASTAEVSVAGSSYLLSSTYFKVGTGADSVSKVTVTGSGSYLKTGRGLSVATGSGATGTLRLEGGYLALRPFAVTYAEPHETLVFGSASSVGRFEGWGSISYHTTQPKAGENLFGIFLDGGQVIADGAGSDRDLCLNNLTDVGRATDEGNASGSNGWYAVDHGRVVYPHARSVAKDGSFCVGDYYAKTTPDLVNACAVTFAGNPGGLFLHAALYAPDRTDVPTGLVCDKKDKVLGIWRMGYCTGESGAIPGEPRSFDSASLKFRYDALAAGKGTKYAERYLIETYRYDGTSWQKVAAQENDTDNALVTLTGITPYTDSGVPGYNLGWTAIVARYQPPGMAILLK